MISANTAVPITIMYGNALLVNARPRSFTNRNEATMNPPRRNPSAPTIVTVGTLPTLYPAPGEASYTFFARYGSRAAASADSTMTAPFAKVTPSAHFVLQSPTLLKAQITGSAARKYATWAFTGVFQRGFTLANQSGSRPSSPWATMIRVVPI